MAVRFFGQYLLENGVIDAKQLLAAISYQEKTNLKFGDTAISLGLLTQEQLASIFALQRTKDLKTGEACIELGYLKEEQIDQVLRAQKNSHVMIGEALVSTGALGKEQLERHLAAFKIDQEPYRVSDGIDEKKDPSGVARPATDLALKFLLRLANFNMKLVGVEIGALPDPALPTYTARVAFTGDTEGEIALRASTSICARIASSMLGEPVSPENAPVVLDATSEFLNVVGGNLSAAVARLGKKLELAAPRHGELGAPKGSQHMVVAKLGAPEGEIEFIVITGKP
jgi:hypothetical protein